MVVVVGGDREQLSPWTWHLLNTHSVLPLSQCTVRRKVVSQTHVGEFSPAPWTPATIMILRLRRSKAFPQSWASWVPPRHTRSSSSCLQLLLPQLSWPRIPFHSQEVLYQIHDFAHTFMALNDLLVLAASPYSPADCSYCLFLFWELWMELISYISFEEKPCPPVGFHATWQLWML